MMNKKGAKRTGINFNVHISSRAIYSMIAILIVLTLGVGVLAYTAPADYISSGASHSLTELEPPTNCNGKVLKITDSNTWDCSSPLVSPLTANLDAGNQEILNVNGIMAGKGDATSPGSWAGQFIGKVWVSNYLAADSVYIGGYSTDPGDNNLIVDGVITGATLDTGQGANDLWDMDQNVKTTSIVDFATENT